MHELDMMQTGSRAVAETCCTNQRKYCVRVCTPWLLGGCPISALHLAVGLTSGIGDPHSVQLTQHAIQFRAIRL